MLLYPHPSLLGCPIQSSSCFGLGFFVTEKGFRALLFSSTHFSDRSLVLQVSVPGVIQWPFNNVTGSCAVNQSYRLNFKFYFTTRHNWSFCERGDVSIFPMQTRADDMLGFMLFPLLFMHLFKGTEVTEYTKLDQ